MSEDAGNCRTPLDGSLQLFSYVEKHGIQGESKPVQVVVT